MPLPQLAPEVPPPLAHVVERCLKKDPLARYQTAGELAAALEVVYDVYAS